MSLISKRGNAVLDGLLIFVVIFILAVSYITISYIQSELNDDIQADTTMTAQAKQVHQDMTDNTAGWLDKGIVSMLILFWILSLIAASFIDTHPVWMVISILLLLFALAVIVVLGNTFYEIFTEDITGMSGSYPATFFIFNNILIIGIVMMGSVIMTAYMRYKQ